MTITILQAYTSCFYKTSRSRFFHMADLIACWSVMS